MEAFDQIVGVNDPVTLRLSHVWFREKIAVEIATAGPLLMSPRLR